MSGSLKKKKAFENYAKLVEVIFCRMWNDNMKTPWI
jgi:hypothetical protein